MLQALKKLSSNVVFKFLIVLILWTTVLLFILRIYNNENPYLDRYNVIQRKKKFTEFFQRRKLFESANLSKAYEAMLLLDNSHAPNQEEIIAAIEAEHPSIAFRFWFTRKRQRLQKSKDCAKFPSLLELKYHNKYWQTFTKQGLVMHLYNAYYDERAALPKGAPLVRLLAMSNETEFTPHNIYCQLWYADSREPSFSKANDFHSIWNLKWGNKKGHFYPYLISCPLPQAANETRVPNVVSLVAKECDMATNTLRIHHETLENGNATKQHFAICVKGMDYPYTDISARLVEWLELQFMLGASKIFFYDLEMHPNVTKVLEYYKQRDLVDIRPITLAGGEPRLTHLQHFLLGEQRSKKRLNELIPYNDCFYRNIYRYDFIAVQDIDEVIMPLGNRTKWTDLLAADFEQPTKKCPNGYAAYCFRNVYFSNSNNSAPRAIDVPGFMHMLQHVERNSTHMKVGTNTKCFHRTDRVVTLHNHFSRSWLNVCAPKTVDAKVAQLHHYREEPHLKDTVIDISIWRYKKELLQRSLEALKEMGFLQSKLQDAEVADDLDEDQSGLFT